MDKSFRDRIDLFLIAEYYRGDLYTIRSCHLTPESARLELENYKSIEENYNSSDNANRSFSIITAELKR